MRIFLQKNLAIFLISILILLTSSWSSLAGDEDTLLQVHFLDVGQADSILVELPGGANMLIDGGNNADGPWIVEYLQERGIKKVDYLIGTHPHEDHIGGLDNVIRALEVGKVYLPQVIHTSKTYEDLLLAIKAKGLKITPARAGQMIIDKENLQIKILSPIKEEYKELNEYSVVIRMDYQDISFLFTGDAEAYNEQELLQSGVELTSTVLKVGHHGSDSSTREDFLKAVSPDYAVISVGKDNSYGHPSALVLERLKKHGVQIFRTDKQGTIILTTDGRELSFKQEYEYSPWTGIYIEQVDLIKEEVKICNENQREVDISGWELISLRGNQRFVFPQDTFLPAGGSLKIVSGPKAEAAPGILVWTRSPIWNNSGDEALLQDAAGRFVSSLEGGI